MTSNETEIIIENISQLPSLYPDLPPAAPAEENLLSATEAESHPDLSSLLATAAEVEKKLYGVQDPQAEEIYKQKVEKDIKKWIDNPDYPFISFDIKTLANRDAPSREFYLPIKKRLEEQGYVCRFTSKNFGIYLPQYAKEQGITSSSDVEKDAISKEGKEFIQGVEQLLISTANTVPKKEYDQLMCCARALYDVIDKLEILILGAAMSGGTMCAFAKNSSELLSLRKQFLVKKGQEFTVPTTEEILKRFKTE